MTQKIHPKDVDFAVNLLMICSDVGQSGRDNEKPYQWPPRSMFFLHYVFMRLK